MNSDQNRASDHVIATKKAVALIDLLFFFIYIGAIRRITSLGEVSFKDYSREMKNAIKNSTQRIYMAKIVCPKNRTVNIEAELTAMYNNA